MDVSYAGTVAGMGTNVCCTVANAHAHIIHINYRNCPMFIPLPLHLTTIFTIAFNYNL